MYGLTIVVMRNSLLPVYYFYIARSFVVHESFERTKRGMDRLKTLPDLTISVQMVGRYVEGFSFSI